MDINLKILKELYLEEIEKFKKLPFYQYFYREKKKDIKRDIFISITENKESDIFKEIEAYLEGDLLKDMREKLGDNIGNDIREQVDETRKSERDKDKNFIEKERSNIKNNEYHHAIDYLCCRLMIKKLQEKLDTLGVNIEIDIEGKVSFKSKN